MTNKCICKRGMRVTCPVHGDEFAEFLDKREREHQERFRNANEVPVTPNPLTIAEQLERCEPHHAVTLRNLLPIAARAIRELVGEIATLRRFLDAEKEHNQRLGADNVRRMQRLGVKYPNGLDSGIDALEADRDRLQAEVERLTKDGKELVRRFEDVARALNDIGWPSSAMHVAYRAIEAIQVLVGVRDSLRSDLQAARDELDRLRDTNIGDALVDYDRAAQVNEQLRSDLRAAREDGEKMLADVADWLDAKSRYFVHNRNIGPYSAELASALRDGSWRNDDEVRAPCEPCDICKGSMCDDAALAAEGRE